MLLGVVATVELGGFVGDDCTVCAVAAPDARARTQTELRIKVFTVDTHCG